MQRRPRHYWAGILMLYCLLWAGALHAAVQVDVVVRGLSNEAQRKNVLAALSINQQKDHPLANRALIRRLHAKAPREIRSALAPFGYYRVKVKAQLKTTDKGLEARYDIEPGPALRIQQLDLVLSGAGRQDPEFQALLAKFPLAVGDVLNHEQYADAKKALQQLAAEHGYLAATFTQHEIQIDLQAYQARIVLHYDTGPRYRFGAIQFRQDILRPTFLEKYAPVKQGDPYSVTNLLSLQKSLTDSGYFSRVDVIPQTERAADLEVPVDVMLAPRKRNRYTAGIGYGTDTGGRVSAGWENRRINRRGHRLGVELLASEINNSQTIRYGIPMQFYQADQLAITANRVHEWRADRDELTRSLSVSRSRGQELWRTTVALTYSDEIFTIGHDRQQTRLLMPSVSWTRINTDNRLYATWGNRYIFDLRGANSDAGSDISFFQVHAQGKWIRKFTAWGRLIGRAEGGYTRVARFDELPSSLRFFTGGDRSVRGYGYEKIAPHDAEGHLVGGKSLVVGSVEYEHPLQGKWNAAVFYDVGNAFDDWHPAPDLKRGTGLGIRWLSPVGQVRLDLAWALDKPDKPWRLHLVIGPDL